uniref:Uncharacterized protein n=1 Tax=Anguilla anguilla TaxID=7936 RepID=A0A0E9SK27_ANGAN
MDDLSNWKDPYSKISCMILGLHFPSHVHFLLCSFSLFLNVHNILYK